MAQARFRRARHNRARLQTGSQKQSRDCRAHIPARLSRWAGLADPYSASYTAWPGLAAHAPVAQVSQDTRESATVVSNQEACHRSWVLPKHKAALLSETFTCPYFVGCANWM